jgi:hypothetical protein
MGHAGRVEKPQLNSATFGITDCVLGSGILHGTGSEADKWLSNVQSSELGGDRVYLHRLLTYDYFAFVKVVRTKGKEWRNLAR